VSAIATTMPRCRFALTRRQWRNRARCLERLREEEQAVAQGREASLHQEVAGLSREAEALRARLAAMEGQHLAEVRAVARHLGDALHALYQEQYDHGATKDRLDTAVRSNESNANAETVTTDVSVLRAAVADDFVDAPVPGPAYGPQAARLSSRPITVLTLPEALGSTQ